MIGRRPSVTVARWAVPVVVGLLVLVFVVQGSNRPVDPYLGAATPTGAAAATGGSARVPVEGFGEIGFRVDSSGVAFGPRSVARRCALLAETFEQRTKGLMNRTDLSGYDGMLFKTDRDENVGFVMTDTLIPLTVAFFEASGRFLSSTDMVPCGDQPSCPVYTAPGPYRMALEVQQGRLASLGIAPGARIIVGGNC